MGAPPRRPDRRLNARSRFSRERDGGCHGAGAMQQPKTRSGSHAPRLVYVQDGARGFRRRRRGRAFVYVGASGRLVHDARVLDRIRRLAIPPAYEDVWICADPHGHLQATGRDARGRKQYRYHAHWHAVRDAAKFSRVVAFARALPALRRRVRADLRRPGLPLERVLATATRLLESTLIRIGNDEYARENGSYGLTTMRCRHVQVRGARMRFGFVGKGAKRHDVKLSNRSLAGILKRCQELPGQMLFQYLGDDGKPHRLVSTDVNDYLREIAGDDYTAKDFRTWAATVAVASAFAAPATEHHRASLTEALAGAAAQLGNTPTVCRKSYVHPDVLAAFTDPIAAEELSASFANGKARRGLGREETAVLRYLERRARVTRSGVGGS
jgi:DNA topoisomerase-1